MTLQRSINEHVGASSDTKPTTDQPVGSRFTELDTGDVYVWNGAKWGTFIPADILTPLLMEMADTLERIQQQLSQVTGINLARAVAFY